MIPGFSGHTIALLLILQWVPNNRQNFEQPLSTTSLLPQGPNALQGVTT